jgi:hypothetical protein
VKTAPGDLDYAVVLKYGGKMQPLGSVSSVNFPLVHTKNINIERSIVQLRLPETYRWFNFGGTMRLAGAEGDVAAGILSYQSKEAGRLMETMRQANPFAQTRAQSNFQTLQSSMEQTQALATRIAGGNAALQNELKQSAGVLQQARQEIYRAANSPAQGESQDNGDRLNDIFSGQKHSRARNVVKDLGDNWSDVPEAQLEDRGKSQWGTFNRDWFENNALVDDSQSMEQEGGQKQQSSGDVSGFGGRGSGYRIGKKQVANQPAAPEIRQEVRAEDGDMLQRQSSSKSRRSEFDQKQDVTRYQRKLEQKQGGQQQANAQPQFQSQNELAPAALVPTAEKPAEPMEEAANEKRKERFDLSEAAIAAGPAGETGLASLEFQLPQRGSLYQFTTPRGEVEITAEAVSDDLLGRLFNAAIALAAIVVVGYAVRLASRGRLGWLGGPAATTLMLCLGMLAIVTGVLPIAGILMFACGAVILKIRRLRHKHSYSTPDGRVGQA